MASTKKNFSNIFDSMNKLLKNDDDIESLLRMLANNQSQQITIEPVVKNGEDVAQLVENTEKLKKNGSIKTNIKVETEGAEELDKIISEEEKIKKNKTEKKKLIYDIEYTGDDKEVKEALTKLNQVSKNKQTYGYNYSDYYTDEAKALETLTKMVAAYNKEANKTMAPKIATIANAYKALSGKELPDTIASDVEKISGNLKVATVEKFKEVFGYVNAVMSSELKDNFSSMLGNVYTDSLSKADEILSKKKVLKSDVSEEIIDSMLPNSSLIQERLASLEKVINKFIDKQQKRYQEYIQKDSLYDIPEGYDEDIKKLEEYASLVEYGKKKTPSNIREVIETPGLARDEADIEKFSKEYIKQLINARKYIDSGERYNEIWQNLYKEANAQTIGFDIKKKDGENIHIKSDMEQYPSLYQSILEAEKYYALMGKEIPDAIANLKADILDLADITSSVVSKSINKGETSLMDLLTSNPYAGISEKANQTYNDYITEARRRLMDENSEYVLDITPVEIPKNTPLISDKSTEETKENTEKINESTEETKEELKELEQQAEKTSSSIEVLDGFLSRIAAAKNKNIYNPLKSFEQAEKHLDKYQQTGSQEDYDLASLYYNNYVTEGVAKGKKAKPIYTSNGTAVSQDLYAHAKEIVKLSQEQGDAGVESAERVEQAQKNEALELENVISELQKIIDLYSELSTAGAKADEIKSGISQALSSTLSDLGLKAGNKFYSDFIKSIKKGSQAGVLAGLLNNGLKDGTVINFSSNVAQAEKKNKSSRTTLSDQELEKLNEEELLSLLEKENSYLTSKRIKNEENIAIAQQNVELLQKQLDVIKEQKTSEESGISKQNERILETANEAIVAEQELIDTNKIISNINSTVSQHLSNPDDLIEKSFVGNINTGYATSVKNGVVNGTPTSVIDKSLIEAEKIGEEINSIFHSHNQALISAFSFDDLLVAGEYIKKNIKIVNEFAYGLNDIASLNLSGLSPETIKKIGERMGLLTMKSGQVDDAEALYQEFHNNIDNSVDLLANEFNKVIKDIDLSTFKNGIYAALNNIDYETLDANDLWENVIEGIIPNISKVLKLDSNTIVPNIQNNFLEILMSLFQERMLKQAFSEISPETDFSKIYSRRSINSFNQSLSISNKDNSALVNTEQELSNVNQRAEEANEAISQVVNNTEGSATTETLKEEETELEKIKARMEEINNLQEQNRNTMSANGSMYRARNNGTDIQNYYKAKEEFGELTFKKSNYTAKTTQQKEDIYSQVTEMLKNYFFSKGGLSSSTIQEAFPELSQILNIDEFTNSWYTDWDELAKVSIKSFNSIMQNTIGRMSSYLPNEDFFRQHNNVYDSKIITELEAENEKLQEEFSQLSKTARSLTSETTAVTANTEALNKETQATTEAANAKEKLAEASKEVNDSEISSDSSLVGKSYEEVISYLQKENEEIAKGNQEFKERKLYFDENNKVLAEYLGEYNEVTGAAPVGAVKSLHTHPDEAYGGHFSTADIEGQISDLINGVVTAELYQVKNGIVDSKQYDSNKTKSYFDFPALYGQLTQTIVTHFGEEVSDGKWTISNESDEIKMAANEYYKALSQSVLSQISGEDFDLSKFNVDKDVFNSIQELFSKISGIFNQVTEKTTPEEFQVLNSQLSELKRDYKSNSLIANTAETNAAALEKQAEAQEHVNEAEAAEPNETNISTDTTNTIDQLYSIFNKSNSNREEFALGNSSTGLWTNPAIGEEYEYISEELIENVIKNCKNQVDSLIHTHPANLAVFSPEDIYAAIEELNNGIVHQYVKGISETTSIDFSQLTKKQWKLVAQKYEEGFDKLVETDGYQSNASQEIVDEFDNKAKSLLKSIIGFYLPSNKNLNNVINTHSLSSESNILTDTNKEEHLEKVTEAAAEATAQVEKLNKTPVVNSESLQQEEQEVETVQEEIKYITKLADAKKRLIELGATKEQASAILDKNNISDYKVGKSNRYKFTDEDLSKLYEAYDKVGEAAKEAETKVEKLNEEEKQSPTPVNNEVEHLEDVNKAATEAVEQVEKLNSETTKPSNTDNVASSTKGASRSLEKENTALEKITENAKLAASSKEVLSKAEDELKAKTDGAVSELVQENAVLKAIAQNAISAARAKTSTVTANANNATTNTNTNEVNFTNVNNKLNEQLINLRNIKTAWNDINAQIELNKQKDLGTAELEDNAKKAEQAYNKTLEEINKLFNIIYENKDQLGTYWDKFYDSFIRVKTSIQASTDLSPKMQDKVYNSKDKSERQKDNSTVQETRELSDLEKAYLTLINTEDEYRKAKAKVEASKNPTTVQLANLNALNKAREKALALTKQQTAQTEQEIALQKKYEEEENKTDNFVKNAKTGAAASEMSKLADKAMAMSQSGKYLSSVSDELKTLAEAAKRVNLTETLNPEEIEKYSKALSEAIKNADKLGNEVTLNKLGTNIAKTMNDNTAMTAKLRVQYQALIDDVKNYSQAIKNGGEISAEAIRDLSLRFTNLNMQMEISGKTGKSFFTRIKDAVTSANAQLFNIYFSWMDWIRYIRSTLSAIEELDTALIDLKKTTVMTDTELDEFYYDANDVAKQMGVTTEEIISQAAAWSRFNKIDLLYGNI